MEDGVDYVPADTNVVFGHQFASIAGAGPVSYTHLDVYKRQNKRAGDYAGKRQNIHKSAVKSSDAEPPIYSGINRTEMCIRDRR